MVTVGTLRPCELFAGLTDEELSEIAAITREQVYDAGAVICAEQEQADHLFILSKGCVQVDVRLHSPLEAGGETTIEEVQPGRIFGWSSLVKQRRFTASARAVEPSSVLVVDASELNAVFDRHPHLGFVVMKQLAEVIASRLRHTRDVCRQTADCD
jgi:CRP/FNR family cyclic AMP-dependent transcriptional regulator